MENANKALIMAGSTLLAVMVLVIVIIFFKYIGAWPETQDELLTTEQIGTFNAEYEVYQKSAMYGVDVISCLNKAKSNNEKYAEGGSFLGGSAYGEAYYIDVYVKINSALEENLTVYYYNTSNKEVIKYVDDSTTLTMGNMGTKNGKKLSFNNLPTTSGNGYTTFYEGTKLKTTLGVKLTGGKYLEANGGSYTLKENGTITGYYSLRDSDKKIEELLKFSGNNIKQTINNTTGTNLDVWSSAIWETALYDFKKKKFKCDYIGYNQDTGLVNQLWFSEI